MMKGITSMLQMQAANAETLSQAYHVFGDGKIGLVIEMGLGATAGEWWHIAQSLSEKYTVLLYERNRVTTPARTPRHIAEELFALLERLGCEEKLLLVAHSQGGLYAQQFARLYPQKLKGVVLLDPLSANDSSYKTVLSPEEQKKSGFDKSENLVAMEKLAKLHLGFVIKAVMKKAPPFYYYDGFTKDATDSILSSITVPSIYAAALEEYRLAHDDALTAPLKDKAGFPDIPLYLVTHTSEFMIGEIMEFGRAERLCAEKVETLWQSLMKEYLALSAVSTWRQAKNSGHYMHLTEPEWITDGLMWIESRRDA